MSEPMTPPTPIEEQEKRCPTCTSDDPNVHKRMVGGKLMFENPYDPTLCPNPFHRRPASPNPERWWVQRYESEHPDEPDTLKGVIGVNPVNKHAWIEVISTSALEALAAEWEKRAAEEESYIVDDAIHSCADDLRTLLQGQADKGGSDG